MTYRERVYPRWGTFLVLWLFSTMLAIAYSVAIDPWVGTLIFAGIGLGGSIVLVWMSPVIHVTESSNTTTICVGVACIPRDMVISVDVLSPESMAETVRAGDYSTAYIEQRGGLPGVLIQLSDHNDPHGYWLVSTRHPQDFAQSLGQSKLSG